MLITCVALIIALVLANQPISPIIRASATIALSIDDCISIDNDAGRTVCVCNEYTCNDLKFTWPSDPGNAYLVQSTKSGRRFHISTLKESSESRPESSKIRVDVDKEYQSIMGFGGAFTDAASININSLPDGLAKKLIDSYYGENGLQYSFGRVPIAGTDFSVRPYTYDDSTGMPDYELSKWTLAPEDIDHKIPLIKYARETAAKYSNSLKLFASPWSPPSWMKDNNKIVRGHLIDDDRIYTSYANYLVKFYQAYKEHGLEFWGATVQNEPVAAFLPIYFFNSLQIGNAQMIKFISKYLGPALEAAGYTKDNFKLMVGDDSLGFVNYQVASVLSDPEVRKYVSGLAFHWYTSGMPVSYNSLSKLVDSIKDHIEFVLMTEACTGTNPTDKHVDLGSWDRAQIYASDIIEDLLRHAGGWIDWNLALDQEGGPNWAKNFVDSPIIVNKNKREFYKQPMYYALAHFSRFFRPGSVRVGAKIENRRFFERLSTVAVHKKDSGHVVVNILNKSGSEKQLEINLTVPNQGSKRSYGPFKVEGKSLSSVIIKL